MLGQPGRVEKTVALQHVDQATDEGHIGARPQLEVVVATSGSCRAKRVDGDHLGTPPPGCFDHWPEVTVGEQRVGAPQDDVVAQGEIFGIDAEGDS